MKTKIFTVLLLLSVSFFSISCSNDEIDNYVNVEEQSTEHLEFTYKGKLYDSNYIEKNNVLVFEDEEVQAIYDEIGANKERLVHFNTDGKVVIYET